MPKQNLDELDLRLRQFTAASRDMMHRAKPPNVPCQADTAAQTMRRQSSANLMFDMSLETPGSSNSFSRHSSYSDSDTAVAHWGPPMQSASLPTSDEPGLGCTILSPSQSQRLQGSDRISFQQTESSLPPWLGDDFSQAQTADGLAENFDWSSFSTNADMNRELSYCYEAFSETFLD